MTPVRFWLVVLLLASGWWLVNAGFTWSRKRRIRQRLNELHAHEQARVVRIAERAARRKAERGE